MSRRLIARLDNVGDVLLTGPSVRAVAAGGEPVVFLAGPRGAEAAALLPGVDEVIVFDAPWVALRPSPVDETTMTALVDRIRMKSIETALILTSFHQSPLPLALLLRLAGVKWIGATCVDYPGALLDLRHPYHEALHEVEQSLSLCAASGFSLPDDDDARLRLRPLDPATVPDGRYVIVHAGASVPARGLPPGPAAGAVQLLAETGYHVIVTGTASELPLARSIAAGAPPGSTTMRCGTTSLVDLAALVQGAEVVVCGNTGMAHLAAATGTPVVEAYAPVVPAHRWRPWRVPHVLLGDLDVACAGCRARVCPLPAQVCLAPFTPLDVLEAVQTLAVEHALAPHTVGAQP